MNKKKKKKSSEGPKPLISKKTRKRFLKLLILTILGGGGYIFSNPNVIPDPQQREQVLNAKDYLLHLNDRAQASLVDALPQTQQITSHASQLSQNGVVLGDQEINVEEVIRQAAQSLENIPQNQLQRFKTDFCADVIQNAVNNATTSATP